MNTIRIKMILPKTHTSNSLEQIRLRLGKPFFEAPNCLIYNTDCVEALKQLESAEIDLTITSPPYNIGKEYETVLSIEDYVTWSELWINEIHRVTKHNGSFWLNLGYLSLPNTAKAIPIAYLLWSVVPFYLIQEIVWHYGAGVAGKKFFSPRNEKFLWYVKNQECYTFDLDAVRDPNVKYPNQKKNGKLKVNPLGKNPSDVWEFPKVTSGSQRSSIERTAHPAQFPIAVIERIVLASSSQYNLILDPFMGSGTTACAALKNNRAVVGFEINTGYCELTASRIENLLMQQNLFL